MTMKYVQLGLLCLLLAVVAIPASAAPPGSCGTLNAGLQIVSAVPTSGSNYPGSLKMAIWYPTSAAASSYTYSGGLGAVLSGQVALNAAVSGCAQFPLIIFSHGWAGCGTQSVFLTEQLARLGYIVAAPDHNDHGCSVDGTSISLLQVYAAFPFSQFGDASSWTDQTALYRNNDMEAVLSYMLNSWSGKSAVNANEIVAAGHSFGGYTAFAKIGGWSSWLNPKFKAGIMYSPYVQAFQAQIPQTVSSPTVPQLFMTGGPDDKGIQPWIIGPQPCSGSGSQNCGQPGAFEQSAGVKYYGELAGSGNQASHYAFANIICSDAGLFTVQSCLAGDPNAQAIVNYTQDFLEHFLAGQAPRKLWSAGPEFATWWQTAGEPSGSFKVGAGAAASEVITLFGERLTTDAAAAADGAIVMPQSLAQTSVSITDSQGVTRPGNLYYISPSQVNVVVPAGTAAGQATISVQTAGNKMSSGPITIKAVAPALYALPGNVLAGWGQAGNNILPIWSLAGAKPFDVSQGNVYLICLGTGLRGGSNTSLTAIIGNVQFNGVSAPRPALASSPSYMGLDQINIGPIPASMQGAGKVNVMISVDGVPTNTVQVAIQ
jgi:uncharacterized protein (TIGR03437 family)